MEINHIIQPSFMNEKIHKRPLYSRNTKDPSDSKLKKGPFTGNSNFIKELFTSVSCDSK